MPPGAVPLQPLHQVEPGRFEFIPDKAQAEQPAAEGVLLVVRHHRLVGGGALGESLMADRQAELDVGLDFPSVGGGIEAAEFDGALGEYSVVVQHVVAGLRVMDGAFIGAVVPDALELGTGGGLGGVQALHEFAISLLAVVHPGRSDAQCMHQHVLPAGEDVRQVTQALRGVRRGVDVNMDTAGAVHTGTGFAQQPHDFLDGLDIRILADGRNDLAGVGTILGGIAILGFLTDGSVAHGLPLTANTVKGAISIVGAAFVDDSGISEIAGHDGGGFLAGDAGQFDFDTEVLVLHDSAPCF